MFKENLDCVPVPGEPYPWERELLGCVDADLRKIAYNGSISVHDFTF